LSIGPNSGEASKALAIPRGTESSNPIPSSDESVTNCAAAGKFRNACETEPTQNLFNATEVLIEDKASGTQLIQELIDDGCHGVTPRSSRG
jgi:hypothetical protein